MDAIAETRPSWRFGGIAIRKNVRLVVPLTEHTAQYFDLQVSTKPQRRNL
jgi:hypothetical protein